MEASTRRRKRRKRRKEASIPRRKRRLPSPESAAPSLDSLPPELLEKIVSRLPVRDAVRTSALSHAWRRRWESAPGLRFHFRRSDASPAAIGAVLARYSCSVRKFRHRLVDDAASGYTDEWLRTLAAKGVLSLTLHFAKSPLWPDELYIIGNAIFSCRELTRLDLARCSFLAAPSCFAGFANLTSLSLSRVGFLEHGEKLLEAMISAAPLLELLELKGLWFISVGINEWVIRAPNLRNLNIALERDYGLQIEELPSLQRVSMNIDPYSFDRDFVRLLKSFVHATHFEFRMPVTEGNAVEGLPRIFHNLKKMTLITDLCNMANVLAMFSLLSSAPNLKELEIQIIHNGVHDQEIDNDFYNALLSNDLFASLDVVTMKGAPCWPNEMQFIEFVLSKARLLSAFYIYRDDDDDYEDDDDDDPRKSNEEILIELTKYKRVSPNAKVFFRNMDDDE